MGISERIRYFRTKFHITQKYLGQCLGFPAPTAAVRLNQYETGTRTPKPEVIEAMAAVLGVSPQALTAPDLDSYTGVMHTLFAMEDLYGLQVTEQDGEVCLRVNVRQGKDAAQLHQMLCAWQAQAEKLRAGKISREAYDDWRYCYPERDDSQKRVKLTSQGLSDMLVEELKKDSSAQEETENV